MKIIDLLNRIANGEEVPKRIIYGKYLWWWCEPCKCYEARTETGHEINLYYYLSKEGDLKDDIEIALLSDDEVALLSDDEVEIIEENKKIEPLKIEQDTPSSNFYIRNEYGTKCGLTKHSKMIAEKVNELIREINKMKKD